FGLDRGVPRVRDDLAALVLVLGLADDEEHLAAALAGLLEDVLGPRAERQHVTGADWLHVLELLRPVEEAAEIELHGAPRLPEVADPVRDRHEERRRRDRRVGLVRGVLVLHGARELADLPELDAHRPLGTPDTDQRAIDFGHGYNPINWATSSRFHVASPNVTSELFARLK